MQHFLYTFIHIWIAHI